MGDAERRSDGDSSYLLAHLGSPPDKVKSPQPPSKFVPLSCHAPQKDAWLRLPSVSQQYPYVFSDQGYSLRGKAFNVTLVWDVQPFVGRIYSGAKSFGPWTISEDYVTLERSKR